MKQKIFIAGSALISLVVNLFGGWDTALETLILFRRRRTAADLFGGIGPHQRADGGAGLRRAGPRLCALPARRGCAPGVQGAE